MGNVHPECSGKLQTSPLKSTLFGFVFFGFFVCLFYLFLRQSLNSVAQAVLQQRLKGG